MEPLVRTHQVGLLEFVLEHPLAGLWRLTHCCLDYKAVTYMVSKAVDWLNVISQQDDRTFRLMRTAGLVHAEAALLARLVLAS